MRLQNIVERIGELVPDMYVESYNKEASRLGMKYTRTYLKDPSLADVLRAIGGKNFEMKKAIYIDVFGSIVDYNTKQVVANWDLTKPLSGQSQEVCDFLGKILK